MLSWFEKEKKGSNEKTEQLEGEIQSLNIRKNTALSVYQKDLQEMENTRDVIINNIGTEAYSKYLSHEEICLDDFKDFWARLDKLSQDIESSTKKKDEIIARYDEEIDMLCKELNYSVGNVKESRIKTCHKCGAQIREDDIFCEHCGVKQM